MEVRAPLQRQLTDHRPSAVTVKYSIRANHGDTCNCCCCRCYTVQPTLFKYIQPEIPKSFTPIRKYWRSSIPMEKKTTYKLSYWSEKAMVTPQPFRPQPSLTTGDGCFEDKTIHKMSYWGYPFSTRPKESRRVQCISQFLGRGPMQNATTQKCDYIWKCVPKSKALKAEGNLYCPPTNISSNTATTYNLSYYKYGCLIPVTSFKPVRKHKKYNVPIDDCTIYKLSYWPDKSYVKRNYPWNKKTTYQHPLIPVERHTTYNLSYWPNKQPVRKPFTTRDTENLLNAGCCFDENTTYNLSYFGCGIDDKRHPIKPLPSAQISTCPLSHDTTHKLSYLGNWCVQPETPCIPCSHEWSGRGPIQDVTTQKHDFTWKCREANIAFRPKNNLKSSSQLLECCTTHRLSYFPNKFSDCTQNKSFKPIRKYVSINVPMDNETTMKLSYQPVESVVLQKKTQNTLKYSKPFSPVDDNTTYNLSYVPPGQLEPVRSLSCPESVTSVISPCTNIF